MLSDQDALSTTRSRLSAVRNDVFSEVNGVMSIDPRLDPAANSGVGKMLRTICQLTAAWSVQQQPEILVHALILMETMIRPVPG